MRDESHAPIIPDHFRPLFARLQERVREFGSDVAVLPNSRNYMFRSRLNFAEVRPGIEFLRVWLRPEGFSIPERGTAVVSGLHVYREPDANEWAVTHRIDVDNATPFEAMIQLLRQSYDAVRALRPVDAGDSVEPFEPLWVELLAALNRLARCPDHPEYPCVRTLTDAVPNDVLSGDESDLPHEKWTRS